MLHALTEKAGSAEKLVGGWGTVSLGVYPTGPFHLQLGQNFGPGPGATSKISLQDAVKALNRSNDLVFSTAGNNPSHTILPAVYKSLHRKVLGGSMYETYFNDFEVSLFSLGGLDAGVHFHYHACTWLYLASGAKEWVQQPWDAPLLTYHAWAKPAEWLLESEVPILDSHDSAHTVHVGANETKHWLSGEHTFHTIQRAGQVMVQPSYWWHATRNLHPFTLGFGKQKLKVLDESSAPPLLKAQKDAMQNNHPYAIELLTPFVENNPGDVSSRLRLLLLLLRTGRLKEAHSSYKRAYRDLREAVQASVISPQDFEYAFSQKMSRYLNTAIDVALKDGTSAKLRFLRRWLKAHESIQLPKPLIRTTDSTNDDESSIDVETPFERNAEL